MNEVSQDILVPSASNAEMIALVENAPVEALYQLPTSGKITTAEELRSDSCNRRAFLQRMGAAGLGFAAIGLLNGCNGDDNGGPEVPNPTVGPNPTGTPQAQGIDPTNFPGIIGRNIDEVVLNFTLAHEHLEVDLYRQALNIASGLPIDTTLDASRNYSLRISPGSLNQSSGQAAEDGLMFLKNQAFVEVAHRDFLITTVRSMGGTPQPPNPAGYQFPNGPGSSLSELMANIVLAEMNGQRGLLGGSTFLTSLALIQTSATLHSIETRHIAALKHTLGRNPGPEKMDGDLMVVPNYPSPDTFEYYRTPPTVIARDRSYYRTSSA